MVSKLFRRMMVVRQLRNSTLGEVKPSHNAKLSIRQAFGRTTRDSSQILRNCFVLVVVVAKYAGLAKMLSMTAVTEKVVEDVVASFTRSVSTETAAGGAPKLLGVGTLLGGPRAPGRKTAAG